MGEQDIAPNQIIAPEVANNVTTFTRPLCPYPPLPCAGIDATPKTDSSACIDHGDHDVNQPPVSRYINDYSG
jgi:hypothetical protein